MSAFQSLLDFQNKTSLLGARSNHLGLYLQDAVNKKRQPSVYCYFTLPLPNESSSDVTFVKNVGFGSTVLDHNKEWKSINYTYDWKRKLKHVSNGVDGNEKESELSFLPNNNLINLSIKICARPFVKHNSKHINQKGSYFSDTCVKDFDLNNPKAVSMESISRINAIWCNVKSKVACSVSILTHILPANNKQYSYDGGTRKNMIPTLKGHSIINANIVKSMSETHDIVSGLFLSTIQNIHGSGNLVEYIHTDLFVGLRFCKSNITTSILLDKEARPTVMVDYSPNPFYISNGNANGLSVKNSSFKSMQNNSKKNEIDPGKVSMSLFANKDSFSVFYTLARINISKYIQQWSLQLFYRHGLRNSGSNRVTGLKLDMTVK